MHRINELKPLKKETISKVKAERPTQFDYQARIKKIVLSSEGDTKHYDGLGISEALMQMPFIEFDTAVIKVSNFITFAKKEVVEVNNLDELSGKAIQVMYGESEIMVMQIIGKEDSLIWWGNDVNHQMELQILTSNRNLFCPSNQEFSFDVIGSIKIGYMQVNVASNLEAIMNSDNELDHDSYKEKINFQKINRLNKLKIKKSEFDDLKNTSSITNSGVFFMKHEEKKVVQDIENSLAKFQGDLPTPGLFSNQVKGKCKRNLIYSISEEPNVKRVKHNSDQCQSSTTGMNENIEIFNKIRK